MTSRAIDAVARFARLLATSPTSGALRDLLVETAVEVIGGRAAVLVQLDDAGAPRVVARRGLADDVRLPPEVLATGDLAHALLAATGGAFRKVEQMPLVAEGGLYGILAVLFEEDAQLGEEKLKLCGAIVDIAATTIARSREVDELERARDALDESRRALGQAEKLRALGGMAAGVSHDLKNVFGPLLMQLDVIAKKADLDAAFLRERLEKMRRPLENGLAIVERLRSFGRRTGSDEREIVDVFTIVDDAAGLARPRAGSHVHVVVEAGDAPPVRVEVAEAVAAVTNVVFNAIDAVAGHGGEGTVTVRTSGKNDGAVIEIVDTGPGIPADVAERIFEPFFSTKGKKGTGLGLAMVRDFVQRHGGTVAVRNLDGSGACFTLWLPSARPPVLA